MTGADWCALTPAQRLRLIDTWRSLLKLRGKYHAVQRKSNEATIKTWDEWARRAKGESCRNWWENEPWREWAGPA